ncbi:hypothetical protein L4X63_13075 [Geomonas sp. Red32]|uniref:hypothetical protein n=1 Tax=Geomonas sp. Red32 TaxID=2912856 RepID=UPI00202D093D|nr:hypothetical protein [Geomonas sp. Red32]MCM0082525.1 hypothetical protein [Geomonas sp. Red32]
MYQAESNIRSQVKGHDPSAEVEVDKDQSFQITVGPRSFYFLSALINSPGMYRVCSIQLLNDYNVIPVVDVIGPEIEKRPWQCEYVDALSFSDSYPDGSIRVIGLYYARAIKPPPFVVPVVLKLDFRNATLAIDEKLTDLLEKEEIETIKAARAFIKKKLKAEGTHSP